MTVEEANKMLLPCPFCGGKAYVRLHVFHDLPLSYGVECYTCGAQGMQFYSTLDKAIERWNRRVNNDS